MNKKLAVVSTHPIQYYAPVFQLLAKEIEIKVFYTWGKDSISKLDRGFKKDIEWDLPLLEGYDYTFVQNIAKDPGTHHYTGIINPTLINQIENYHADAILIYGWAWKSHLKVMRFFSGKIPVYFRGDSTLMDRKNGIKNMLKSILLKFVYRHVDLAFYVGTQNKAYFKKHGLKGNHLVFAPHAVDNERFSEDRSTEADSLRAKLGIGKTEVLILFAGKFEAKKNPMLLLDAFIEVCEEKKKSEVRSQKSEENRSFSKGTPSERYAQDDVRKVAQDEALQQAQCDKRKEDEQRTTNSIHLLFVGNGVLEENLKLRVEGLKVNKSEVRGQKSREIWFNENRSFPIETPSERYAEGDDEESWDARVGRLEEKNGDKQEHVQGDNLKSRIHFMDFQNQTEMPVVYQACDLFCLPSKGPGETWGLAVNEAMACGKAILVSDQVGCGIDLVQNDVNGAIFESGNVDDLTEKLNQLCQTKAKLTSFGKQSKELIKAWSFENQVENILKTVHRK